MKKIFFLICATALLSSCNDKVDYNYLVRNPEVLKNKLDECQTQYDINKSISSQCQLVYFTAQNFYSIINEFNNDPEKIGENMMKLQNELVQLQTEVAAAQKEVDTKDGIDAKAKLVKLKKELEDKQEQQKLLLAVISLTSPE